MNLYSKTKQLFLVYLRKTLNIACSITLAFIGSNVLAQNTSINLQLTDYPKNVLFTHDGSKIITGGKNITIWNAKTGTPLAWLDAHLYDIINIAVSKDDKYLASASGNLFNSDVLNGELKLWEINTAKEIRSFAGHSPDIKSLTFSPDGKKLVVSDDNSIVLWNVETGLKCWSFNNTCYSGMNISYSLDGKTIYAVSKDQILYIDSQTGIINKTLEFNGVKDPVPVFSHDAKKMVTIKDQSIIIMDVLTGATLKSFNIGSSSLKNVSFSPDGKFVICGLYENNSLKLWNIETGKLVNTFEQKSSVSAFSPDGKKLFSQYELIDIQTGAAIWKCLIMGQLKHSSTDFKSLALLNQGTQIFIGNDSYSSTKIIDIENLNEIKTYYGWKYPPFTVSPDGEKFVCQNNEGYSYYLYSYSTKTGEQLKKYTFHQNPAKKIKKVEFTPDGKYIFTVEDNGTSIYETETGKIIGGIADNEIITASIAPDGNHFIYLLPEGNIKLKQIEPFTTLWTKTKSNLDNIKSFHYSPDGKTIFLAGMPSTLINAENGEKIWSNPVSSKNAIFSPDGNKIIINSWYRLKTLDAKTGNEIWKSKTFSDEVFPIAFFPDNKKMLVAEGYGFSIWDMEKGEEIVKYVQLQENEWIIATPDGYFDASLKGGKYIPIFQNDKAYSIDQFAAKYNRPDIILQRLESQNTQLINHYYNQYQKRLKKLKISEAELDAELHVPVAKIINKTENEGFVEITFTLSDTKYNLKSYNIFVNDVPIYGGIGKEITGKSLTLKEKIELTLGENKIEVSCINDKSVQSLRENYTITCEQEYSKSTPDLYYLGFGVSKYQNPQLNLGYADKDVTDLAKLLEKMQGTSYRYFPNVFTKTFINEQVTVENIKNAKEFLKTAKSKDVVILFIAGHGLHDNDPDATYYFLTHNTDLNNLKGTAANFELIEDLLQGIAPRKKLFFMDACESGEIDENESVYYMANAESRGLKSRGFKLSEDKQTEAKTIKNNYKINKNRFIYNDLLRRSGAIVFSSSKGGEYSYEFDKMKNGLFTEYIIKALTTNKVKTNTDNYITTDELRFFVSEEVAKYSGETQHPTIDRDNIFQKFGFPIIISDEVEDMYEMILVNGGSFKNKNSKYYGTSAHVNSFLISKYEVTLKQWNEIMNNYTNAEKHPSDNYPAAQLSWYECIEYCNKRSEKEGLKPYYKIDKSKPDKNINQQFDYKNFAVSIDANADGYRLPTDMEWEYAASGGQLSKSFLYSGSDKIDNVTQLSDINSDEFLGKNPVNPVGKFEPNELDIYDMSGNVAEWCYDVTSKNIDIGIYHKDRPLYGKNHIIRDGAINQFIDKYYSYYIGFRVVRNVPQEK